MPGFRAETRHYSMIVGKGGGMTGYAVALVPAAGRGERLGPGAPKALRELGGEPLLVHAVRSLLASDAVGQVVVAAPAEDVATVEALLATITVGASVQVVAGGATRTVSVGLALAAAGSEWDVVLVHDAARPLVPAAVVDAVAAAVRDGAEAVIPVLPMVDTVKQVDGMGRVIATVPRHDLVIVQTPQGFSRSLLVRAHAVAAGEVTDDAGLVEALGVTVQTVAGHADAMKVTRPGDLVLAEEILARRRGREPSGGTGTTGGAA